MSIQFGVCAPQGSMIEDGKLHLLAQTTARHALDGTQVRSLGRVGMGFQPFHTHLRSRLDSGPIVDRSGNMLALDGRIDNYQDLCGSLGLDAEAIMDSEIVLAAFEKWGEACFSKLVGDWALALWSENTSSLYLARDHAGVRTLYFVFKKDTVLWSTYLETLLAERDGLDLDEAYAACYLAGAKIYNRTPYRDIRSVPPAHYLLFRDGKCSRRPHWQWLPRGTVRYKSDAEYEEHFRLLFRQSVERRTGDGSPVIAQLSGGMDSSSIVCMSDAIRRGRGQSQDQFLDTVSLFDDSEPDWNEKPYFEAVEAWRGKRGIHIDLSNRKPSFTPSPSVYLLPGADESAAQGETDFEAAVGSRGYRAILSGIGGDELLGGVPNPAPELLDYFLEGSAVPFFRQAFAWSLFKRTPIYHTMADAVRFGVEMILPIEHTSRALPSWITSQCRLLVRECQLERPILFYRPGTTASAWDASRSWWSIIDSLPGHFPYLRTRFEYRYPILDRDLVDFSLRVPASQLLRPGERRSLQRRALRGILPPQILNRRRKAYVMRGPLAAIRDHADDVRSILTESAIGELSLVDERLLLAHLQKIQSGQSSEWQTLMRAIQFELWLKSSVTSRRLAA
jgi:asparagine synthase (glutamine-hydrolysing)